MYGHGVKFLPYAFFSVIMIIMTGYTEKKQTTSNVNFQFLSMFKHLAWHYQIFEYHYPYNQCNLLKQTLHLLGDKQTYRISSVIRRSFFLPKQSQGSRSVLQDGSRSLGLFRKGKIGIIAKFQRTGLVI